VIQVLVSSSFWVPVSDVLWREGLVQAERFNQFSWPSLRGAISSWLVLRVGWTELFQILKKNNYWGSQRVFIPFRNYTAFNATVVERTHLGTSINDVTQFLGLN